MLASGDVLRQGQETHSERGVLRPRGTLLRDEPYKVSNCFNVTKMRIRFRPIKRMAGSFGDLSDQVMFKVKHYVVRVDAQVVNQSVTLAKGKTPPIEDHVWSECIPGSPHYPRIKRLRSPIETAREAADVFTGPFGGKPSQIAPMGKVRHKQDWPQCGTEKDKENPRQCRIFGALGRHPSGEFSHRTTVRVGA
jgi:hypothetical protein